MSNPTTAPETIPASEIATLAPTSMILIEWPEGSNHEPYRAIRSGSDSGASSGGIGILDERTWSQVPTWGAQTITVLYRAA